MSRSTVSLLLGLAVLGPFTGSSRAEPASPAAGTAWIASLPVTEPVFDSKLNLTLYHQPDFLPAHPTIRVVLVRADRAEGKDTFFIPSDIALELAERRTVSVDQERTSDLLGQALGGRLRPGETQWGFVVLPAALGVDSMLAAAPESVVVRYAHHRTPFRAATAEEIAGWDAAIDRSLLASALNLWWEWTVDMAGASEMSVGEKRFLAETLFPGQGHVLIQEEMNLEALRNAVIRVGERRLLESPSRRRVAPIYPMAARQVGVGGLVAALCYVTEKGRVADALVLASNTAHLLNVAALSAAMQWEFVTAKNEVGEPTDGWRVLPFHFQIPGLTPTARGSQDDPGFVSPRLVKRVEAEYPERARQKRIEGVVVYRATISAAGKLLAVRLEKGIHPLLEEAALVALEQSLFLPATQNGIAVEGKVSVPYMFYSSRKR